MQGRRRPVPPREGVALISGQMGSSGGGSSSSSGGGGGGDVLAARQHGRPVYCCSLVGLGALPHGLADVSQALAAK
jgi:hypothetical protein